MEIYSYSFLILLLPALSFVILALAGMKMSHKTAGLIGTTSLGLVTVLSYLTAFAYFTADRTADGTYATIVPYNFTWLPLGNLHFDMGILLDPISVMMPGQSAFRHGYPAGPHLGDDAHCHLDSLADGTHLLLRLHAR